MLCVKHTTSFYLQKGHDLTVWRILTNFSGTRGRTVKGFGEAAPGAQVRHPPSGNQRSLHLLSKLQNRPWPLRDHVLPGRQHLLHHRFYQHHRQPLALVGLLQLLGQLCDLPTGYVLITLLEAEAWDQTIIFSQLRRILTYLLQVARSSEGSGVRPIYAGGDSNSKTSAEWRQFANKR